jgi:hypothetical protein
MAPGFFGVVGGRGGYVGSVTAGSVECGGSRAGKIWAWQAKCWHGWYASGAVRLGSGAAGLRVSGRGARCRGDVMGGLEVAGLRGFAIGFDRGSGLV